VAKELEASRALHRADVDNLKSVVADLRQRIEDAANAVKQPPAVEPQTALATCTPQQDSEKLINIVNERLQACHYEIAQDHSNAVALAEHWAKVAAESKRACSQIVGRAQQGVNDSRDRILASVAELLQEKLTVSIDSLRGEWDVALERERNRGQESVQTLVKGLYEEFERSIVTQAVSEAKSAVKAEINSELWKSAVKSEVNSEIEKALSVRNLVDCSLCTHRSAERNDNDSTVCPEVCHCDDGALPEVAPAAVDSCSITSLRHEFDELRRHLQKLVPAEMQSVVEHLEGLQAQSTTLREQLENMILENQELWQKEVDAREQADQKVQGECSERLSQVDAALAALEKEVRVQVAGFDHISQAMATERLEIDAKQRELSNTIGSTLQTIASKMDALGLEQRQPAPPASVGTAAAPPMPLPIRPAGMVTRPGSSSLKVGPAQLGPAQLGPARAAPGGVAHPGVAPSASSSLSLTMGPRVHPKPLEGQQLVPVPPLSSAMRRLASAPPAGSSIVSEATCTPPPSKLPTPSLSSSAPVGRPDQTVPTIGTGAPPPSVENISAPQSAEAVTEIPDPARVASINSTPEAEATNGTKPAPRTVSRCRDQPESGSLQLQAAGGSRVGSPVRAPARVSRSLSPYYMPTRHTSTTADRSGSPWRTPQMMSISPVRSSRLPTGTTTAGSITGSIAGLARTTVLHAQPPGALQSPIGTRPTATPSPPMSAVESPSSTATAAPLSAHSMQLPLSRSSRFSQPYKLPIGSAGSESQRSLMTPPPLRRDR